MRGKHQNKIRRYTPIITFKTRTFLMLLVPIAYSGAYSVYMLFVSAKRFPNIRQMTARVVYYKAA